MKAKEEPSAKMLVCSHCPKEFRYNSERKRHELSHFPRFECEICSKKFSFVSAMRRHQKQHERTGSVKCEECKRKFRDDILLKRHIKYAHKGTFVCEKCNSKFSSDIALCTHMKTHKPESERRFKCSHKGCTKSFNFSHHLKHHVLAHTNAKQYYCSFCGKGFIQSHHLKTHLKVHDPAGWLFCESPGCKKKFSTDYSRKRHMATHMATHKNKPDSGISSDSNSCDASKYTEECNICATCGETVSQNEYQLHSTTCINKEDPNITANNSKYSDILVEEWPDSPFKPNTFKEDQITTKSIIDRGGDCDILQDGCVNNSENRLMQREMQMVHTVAENYNLTSIKNNVNSKNNEDECNNNVPTNLKYHGDYSSKIGNGSLPAIIKISTIADYIENNEKDMCEGCDCANICNAKVSLYDIPPKTVDLALKIDKRDVAASNIEYRNDGVIKIKDTFDDDIVVKAVKDDLKSKRFIPFSTCKDVIGNCLVSGGDGCLCARMMADEDQAIMAQEIDDITPQPKSEELL